MHMRNKFVADSTGYGQTKFLFRGLRAEFYSIFWKTIGLAFLIVFGFGFLTMILVVLIPAANVGPNSFTVPVLLGYAAIGVYSIVRQRNYVWNSTHLGDNRFQSTLAVWEMLGLYASNALVIILSLGLLAPWAQIRLAKYRADHMQVFLFDDWQDTIAASHDAESALGEELGEAFEVDVDIAF